MLGSICQPIHLSPRQLLHFLDPLIFSEAFQGLDARVISGFQTKSANCAAVDPNRFPNWLKANNEPRLRIGRHGVLV
jgi:hypothetical protein